MSGPVWFWALTAFLFGICIGSYLNVVIYRLPLGLSTADPAWSFCPNCRTRLTMLDLVPLFSFLFLGCKCRTCKKPISWRYFSIELLTGVLFTVIFLRFQTDPATALCMILCVAVMVPIFFIDLATFTIPDALNLLFFLFVVGRDVYGLAMHQPGYVLLWGWCPRSIAGGVLGVLVFGAIRVIGWLWKRQEAMGLGDVLLARGMGAMLALLAPVDSNILRLFPMWIILSCLSGMIVGPVLIFFRLRAQNGVDSPEIEEGNPEGASEEIESDGSSFVRELGDVGYCLVLADGWEYLRDLIRRKPAPEITSPEVEDDWKPLPSAIPFGPFLVIGFLATVLVGEWLTALYLAFAFHHEQKPPLPPY